MNYRLFNKRFGLFVLVVMAATRAHGSLSEKASAVDAFNDGGFGAAAIDTANGDVIFASTSSFFDANPLVIASFSVVAVFGTSPNLTNNFDAATHRNVPDLTAMVYDPNLQIAYIG